MRRVLQNHHGVTVTEFSTELYRALDRVADAVVATLAVEDSLADRIKTSYMAYKNLVVA